MSSFFIIVFVIIKVSIHKKKQFFIGGNFSIGSFRTVQADQCQYVLAEDLSAAGVLALEHLQLD